MGNCEFHAYEYELKVRSGKVKPKVNDIISVAGQKPLKLIKITPIDKTRGIYELQCEYKDGKKTYIYQAYDVMMHFEQVKEIAAGGDSSSRHTHRIKTNSGSRKYQDSIVNSKNMPIFHEESKLSNGTITSDINTNMQLKKDTSTDIYGNLISDSQFRNFASDEQ